MMQSFPEVFRRHFGARAHHVEQMILFGVVGGIGALVNTVILWVLTSFAGLHYLIAATAATEVAIVSNFVGNNFLTFRHSNDPASIWRKFAKFQAVSMVALVVTLFLLWALVSSLGEELLLVWNLVAIVGAFLVNFVLNRKFTWRDAHQASGTEKKHKAYKRGNVFTNE